MKDPSQENKPLKRRKKTPSPKQHTNGNKNTKKIHPSPGLSKNIKKLTCDLTDEDNKKPANPSIIVLDSDNEDNKNATSNTADSKPIANSNGHNKSDDNHNKKKTSNPSSTQKKKKTTGRKRKLDEISSDATDNKTNNNLPSDPPKKKARKYYPGYVRQDAPPQHGQIDIPTGKPYCLNNMRFVITGQLPSLTRDECKDLIQQYGGRYICIYYFSHTLIYISFILALK